MLDGILYRFSQVLGLDLDENSNIILLIPKFSHFGQIYKAQSPASYALENGEKT